MDSNVNATSYFKSFVVIKNDIVCIVYETVDSPSDLI